MSPPPPSTSGLKEQLRPGPSSSCVEKANGRVGNQAGPCHSIA